MYLLSQRNEMKLRYEPVGGVEVEVEERGDEHRRVDEEAREIPSQFGNHDF